jgi:hypothetical protein
MQFVIVPGIDNSDQQHWQSIWESEWALLLGVLQLRRGPHLTSTIGWVRLSGPCAWRQPLMWCWLLTAVDVGLLRAGWPTEGPMRWECSWCRHLTTTCSVPLHPVSLLLYLSRSTYLG